MPRPSRKRATAEEKQARRAFKLVRGNGGEWFVVFRRKADHGCPAGDASLIVGSPIDDLASLIYGQFIAAVAREIRRALRPSKSTKKRGRAGK